MKDTRLMSHLLDPRSVSDGSVGLSLEAVTERYAGEANARHYKGELMAHFRANGWPSSAAGDLGHSYRSVDIDEPTYLRYGGVDVLLTCWLYEALVPLIVAGGFSELAAFEFDVARACSCMQRRGIRVDTAYAPQLETILLERGEAAAAMAKTY